ncbi:ligand-binding sensor domain-containing protein [Flavobacterium terrisoli]|uniref:ligand-binding sensor domain-containing protein n=1 Tax=Flavobacterium terrisoli TaxID=3242195 RepID=UPI0025432F03|nr:two-component regulator propeller domain-containing protein [Flavobacterium buctense]
MLQKCFLIALLFGCTLSVQSQAGDYIFKNYDIQDGLCDNNINSIIEDSKGFIWLGTKEGLSRFDGAEFHNFYFTSNSGNAGSYSSLHNLSNDKILLLDNTKMAVLNTTKQSLQLVPKFKNQTIVEINQLSPGKFALNALDSLIIVDSQFRTIDVIKPKGRVYSFLFIRKMAENKYLVGNCFDYYQYDLASKKLTPFPLNVRQYMKGNFGQFELKFIDIGAQKIYIGDYFSGLYIFDYKGQLLQHLQVKPNELTSSNFITYLKDKENNIWIGTHRGINLLKSDKVSAILHRDENDLSVKSNIISSFLLDKNNNLWIGTNQGLSVYKSKLNQKIKSIAIPTSEESPINTLTTTNDYIYAGSYLGKLYRFNQDSKQIESLKNTTAIWGIYTYNNTIYLSGAHTETKIEAFNTVKNQFYYPFQLKTVFPSSDIITMVFKHSNGDFWFSGNAGGGLAKRDAKTGKIVTYYKDQNGEPMFSSSYYSNVCEDADHNLWFGMNRSSKLLQFNYATQRFKEFNFNDFKATKDHFFGGITGIKIDKKNWMWIAFEGGGLIKFNPRSQEVISYNLDNGLTSNYITEIEFDKRERLWLLSNKGVGCLDTKTNTFYPMDIWDGFTDVSSNYIALKMDLQRNTMWIGAMSKLYYFNPDEVLQNKKVSTKIYLEFLKVNQSAVDISQHHFEFKPNQNSMEFRLVAVDIETGKNLEYSYQLQGLSKQWIDLANNRTVSFQKLKAGTYTFNARVRTKGSQQWIYLPQPYTFSIANYFYETWWFMVLMLAAFAFLVWLLFWYNFKKKLEKQKAVDEERNRIAADMHDDLGSGLTKITYLSQMALQKETNNDFINSIKSTSTQLVESMSEIIWAMKEENNTWEELLSYIKIYAQEYCQNNNLNVAFSFPEEDMNFKVLGENRRHIFLSIKECLHNIVKHAAAQNVLIQIEKNSTINVCIKDDGIGMSHSEKRISGNGLKNIAKRMEKIKAQLTILTEKGTTIIFKIPY